jgi:hypothetical protein
VGVHEIAVAHEQVAGEVQQVGQEVGNNGDKEHELGELVRPPRALEVATSIEEGQASGCEAEQVLLDDSREGEDPGVPGHRAAGHDGQPGHAVADAYDGLLDLLDPIGVGAQGEVEQGEQDEGSEDAAGEGREVEAGHGAGASSGECGGSGGSGGDGGAGGGAGTAAAGRDQRGLGRLQD